MLPVLSGLLQRADPGRGRRQLGVARLFPRRAGLRQAARRGLYRGRGANGCGHHRQVLGARALVPELAARLCHVFKEDAGVGLLSQGGHQGTRSDEAMHSANHSEYFNHRVSEHVSPCLD